MTEKSKEPKNMMEFIVSRLDTEDMTTAGLIQPLPADVMPSAQFIQQTRLQILNVVENVERRAA